MENLSCVNCGGPYQGRKCPCYKKHKCANCGGSECELGKVCKQFENVVEFKLKEKSDHDKLSEILGHDAYLVFYPSPDNILCWRVGTPMSVEKLTFVRAVLDQIIHEEMQKLMIKEI